MSATAKVYSPGNSLDFNQEVGALVYEGTATSGNFYVFPEPNQKIKINLTDSDISALGYIKSDAIPTEEELKTMLTASDTDVQNGTGTDFVTAAQFQTYSTSPDVATNAEAQAGTGTGYVTATQFQAYSGWTAIAGTTNTLVSSAAAHNGTAGQTTPEKLKEFTTSFAKAGTMRISYDATKNGIDGGITCSTYIYFNGAQVGTVHDFRPIDHGSATKTWSFDLAVNTTTTSIAIYGHTSSSDLSQSCTIANASIKFDWSPNYPTQTGSVALA